MPKILVGFARKAHNDVHSDENMGNCTFDERHLLRKQLAAIATLHQSQDAVGTRLQGDMKVREEFAPTGKKGDDILPNQVGLNGRHPDTFNAFNLSQCLKQPDERFAGGAAKVAGIHTREYDLFNPLPGYFVGLPHCLCNGYITAFAPCQRDGAIAAAVAASILHFQERPRSVA